MTQLDPKVELDRALALIDLNRPRDASIALRRVVGSEPDNAEAYVLLAQTLADIDDYLGALAAARRGIELDPENEHGFRLVSSALNALGRHQEALTCAQEAVRLAPHEWRGRVMLALALHALALYGHKRLASVEAAMVAVALAPDVATTHFVLGLVSEESEPKLARDSYRKALELDPEHSAAHNSLASLELRRGRLRQAAAGFRAAVVADPKLDLARQNLDIVPRVALFFAELAILVFAIWMAILSDPEGLASHGPTRAVTAVIVTAVAGAVAVAVHRMPRDSLRHLLGALRRSRGLALWACELAVASGCLIAALASTAQAAPLAAFIVVMLFSGWLIRFTWLLLRQLFMPRPTVIRWLSERVRHRGG